MAIEGGCYCGKVRYSSDAEPVRSGQCLCRECQYISGGNANVVMIFPEESVSIIKGEPKGHTREDLENPVTRYFCEHCGTHLYTKSPGAPGALIIKVGTLDDPSMYKGPDMVIWTSEKQDFHHIPDGVPTFPGFPVHE